MRASKTLVIAAVGGLILAGCSGEGVFEDDPTVTVSSGKGGGAELFTAMSDAQVEAGSMTVDMTMTAALSGEEQTVMEATGATEIGFGTANMQLDMSMGAMGAPGAMKVVVLDGVTYTNIFTVMGAPTEKEWVSVDPEADDAFSKTFGKYMEEQAAMADSTAKFEENADALAVEEGTTDTIDGVDVTEYLVTVEKKDFEKLGVNNADQIPIDELTYSLWVDDDYLPYRINFDMGEEAGGVKMELTMADFGKDVTIEAPAEDDFVPVGEFIDSLLESGDVTEEQIAQLEQQFANM